MHKTLKYHRTFRPSARDPMKQDVGGERRTFNTRITFDPVGELIWIPVTRAFRQATGQVHQDVSLKLENPKSRIL
jgi:hypothetical protein